MSEKVSAMFVEEKETKRTKRFAEEIADTAPIMNTAYVQKSALEKLGNPTRIRITIEAVEE